MELSHWRLPSYYAWYVEAELIYSFFEIDENHVGEDLEPVPTAVNNYLTSVPDLTGVAHSRLRQLHFIYFWLIPRLFF